MQAFLKQQGYQKLQCEIKDGVGRIHRGNNVKIAWNLEGGREMTFWSRFEDLKGRLNLDEFLCALKTMFLLFLIIFVFFNNF